MNIDGTKFNIKSTHTLDEDHKPSWIHFGEKVHFCLKNSTKNTSTEWTIFYNSRVTEIAQRRMLMNRMVRESCSVQVASHNYGSQINSNEQTRENTIDYWLDLVFEYSTCSVDIAYIY